MRTPLTLFLSASLALAQDPPAAAPATPATPAVAVPEAGSAAASDLVAKAIEKMQAVGRGTFKTSEAQDSAVFRGAGLPFGDDATEIDGGWHQDLVWGECDGQRFARHAGRLAVKIGDEWKLRANKLGSGRPAPFTLDPSVLFGLLRELPADARKVVHTEAGEVAGKPVAILSLALEGDTAADFAESGAVPPVGSPMGGMVLVGGMGGMELPRPDFTAHVALFVDPSNGDVLRCSVRVVEKNPMAGNVQIQVAGGPGGDDDDDDAEEEKPADKEPAKPEWKKGLPTKKPAKDESVMVYRVDFRQLGLAEPPQLDDKAKALLRVR